MGHQKHEYQETMVLCKYLTVASPVTYPLATDRYTILGPRLYWYSLSLAQSCQLCDFM